MRFRNPMSDDHGPLRSLVEANRLESERANPLLEFRKLAGLDPYLPSLQEGELEDAAGGSPRTTSCSTRR
jgi:hypothetical protein